MVGLRAHLQEHASGRLSGDVPSHALDEMNLGICRVCSRLLSRRFGDACPKCRPALAQPAAAPSTSRPIPPGYPAIREVCTSNVITHRFVPSGAKSLWSDCVTRAFNQTAAHGDQLAWREYFMLARAVLPAKGGRGGRAQAKRAEQHIKTRCRRWLEGDRAALWKEATVQPRKVHKGRRRQLADDTNDSLTHDHVAAGQLSKAAAASVSEPPVEVTQSVIQEMQEKHPGA